MSSSMFGLLCNSKHLFHKRVLLNGHSKSTTNIVLRFLQTPSLTRLISTENTTPSTPNSFTISYLINSCGLPQEKALTISKSVHLKDSSKPDSVLSLFRTYGFTNTHISKVILSRPSLLLYDPIKTLSPKLEFLRSMGLSDPELANLVSRDATILGRNLDNQIIPLFSFLKSILHTEANVIKMLKNELWVLRSTPQRKMIPNIAILKAHGVPDSSIEVLVRRKPGAILQNSDQFNKMIDEIKEMGFHPLKGTFVSAIRVLISMKKSTWEGKREAYKTWGWSDEEIQRAFMKEPLCMSLSEKKINGILDYLVNTMGYTPSVLSKHPTILLHSLEKRIIPRCSVLQILILNSLAEKDCSLVTPLKATEKHFLENYVTKFEEKVPELLNAYKAKGMTTRRVLQGSGSGGDPAVDPPATFTITRDMFESLLVGAARRQGEIPVVSVPLVAPVSLVQPENFIWKNRDFVGLGAQTFSGDGSPIDALRWLQQCQNVFDHMTVTPVLMQRLTIQQLTGSNSLMTLCISPSARMSLFTIFILDLTSFPNLHLH